jgi:hypothetical protein
VLADSIRAQLQRLNSEFAHYVPAGYQLPEVTLRPAELITLVVTRFRKEFAGFLIPA